MKIEDLDEVMLIENDLFEDPWTRSAFEYDLLNNPYSTYYVLKNENEIIGYAGLSVSFEDADVLNIGIKKEYQGRGLGEKLFTHLIEEAKKANCLYMHLEVRESNTVAHNLYKKMGFEDIRIRKNYYAGENGIDMMKGL
ncbi:MAG: ribosomal protein S18-alanine N-acetyltransferase [Erysipelotrichaceae bacterium]|nr:ribosomal protein S18-alanine N-acetyltransferase [Erysipelotrichaceae bacterium]